MFHRINQILYIFFSIHVLNTNGQKPQCYSPDFGFVEELKTVQRFDKYTIQLKNNLDERCVQESKYIWRVYKNAKIVEPVEGVFSRGTSMKNVLDMSTVPLDEVYTALYAVNVVLYPPPIYDTKQISYWFTVIPYDLELNLKDGDFVEYEMGTGGFYIDGSNSTDRSFAENEHPMSGNEIEWKCTPPFRNSEKLDMSGLVIQVTDDFLDPGEKYNCSLTVTRHKIPRFYQTATVWQVIDVKPQPLPYYNVFCKENCDNADPSKATVISIECIAGCKNQIPVWTIEPPEPNVLQNALKEKQTITFPADSFQPGDTITFTAYIRQHANYTKIKYRVPKPEINLTCSENCEYDPRMDVKFKADCIEDCYKSAFTWDITPITSKIKTDKSEDTFTILANAYKEGDEVVLTTKSWETIKRIKFVMVIPTPKLTLLCEKNCNSTDPREIAQFRVSCESQCHFIDYNWSLNPSQPGFDWQLHVDTTKSLLTIDPFTFSDGDHVQFKVETGKGEISLDVDFLIEPPELHLICIDNCIVPNPLLRTLLKVTCEKHCGYLDYKWKLSPEPSANWKGGISNDKTRLSLPPDTFEANETIVFKVSSGKALVTKALTYLDLRPTLEIECLKNCAPTNPLKDATFRAICRDNCIAMKYAWNLTPVKDDFSWNENIFFGPENETLTILSGAFKDGESINLTTKARSGEAVYNITFFEPIANLSIKCVDNCNPSNPKLPTKIVVSCTEYCDNVAYIWNTIPEPINFQWWGLIQHSPDNSTIIIKPNSYQENTNLTLNVTSGKSNQSLIINFEEPRPEIRIICDPPCNEEMNPLMAVDVSISCTKYCQYSTYLWSFKPVRAEFNYWEHIAMQSENKSFVIMPQTFNDGDNVTIEVRSGKANDSVEIKFAEPIPNLEIRCVENCFGSNPLNATVLTAVCKRSCDNVTAFQWDIQPPLKSWRYNVTESPNNYTIKILPRVFQDKDTVNVTVSSRKGNFTMKLKYIEPVPKLTINCISNCDYNPYKPVYFEVKCVKNCQDDHYTWNVSSANSVLDMKTNAYIWPKNKTLKINPNTYKDSDVIAISVTNRKGSERKIITFLNPSPELKIFCVDNCEDGSRANPLGVTRLNVTCMQDCDDTNYTWHFNPPPPKPNPSDFNYIENKTIADIRSNAYKDGYGVRATVKSGNGEAFLDISFVEPTPILNITCVENCGKTADPLHSVKLKVVCKEYCDNLNLLWDISPQERDFSWDKSTRITERNKTFTIMRNTYQSEEVALVTVKSRKGKALYEMKFLLPPPVIELKCSINCPQAYLYENMTLRAVCNHSCDNINYTWKINPLPDDFNWTKSVVFSQSNDTITILRDTFLENHTATIEVLSNDTSSSITVVFAELPPQLTITCISNCEYNPTKSVTLQADCKLYCQQIDYHWEFVPNQFEKIPLINNGSQFTIPAEMFGDLETINVTLKSGKISKSIPITFHQKDWEGSCDIEPTKGRSGYTNFTAECLHYKKNAMYKLYQEIPGVPDKPGVLLTYGPNKFFRNFLLSETNDETHIKILIGSGWYTRATETIPLKVTPFIADVEGKIKLSLIKKRILGNNGDDLPQLARRKNRNRFIQTVSLLDSALSNTPINFAEHMTRHLLEKTLDTLASIEPIQSLSLILKLSTKNYTHHPYNMHLLAENLLYSCERMLKGSTQYPIDITRSFAGDVADLLSYLLTKIETVNEIRGRLSKNDPGFIELNTRPIDIIKHYNYFTLSIIKTTFCLQKLIVVDGNVTYLTSKGLNVTIDANDNNLLLRSVKEKDTNFTFVIIPENLQKNLKANDEKCIYYFAHYGLNPFLWDENGTNLTTDVVQFSILTAKQRLTDLPSPIKIYFNRKSQEETFVTDDVLGFVTFKFLVPENSLFVINLKKIDGNYNITVSSSLPDNNTFHVSGHTVIDNWSMDHQPTGNTVYVGIQNLNSQPVTYNFTYIVYNCMYWDQIDWAWQRSHCRPYLNQPEKYIVCECSKLSLFGARAFSPKYDTKTTEETKLTGIKLSSFFMIFTIAFVILACLALAWAHRLDLRQSKYAKKIVRLNDCAPGESTPYLLMVSTGLMPRSGTTAHVAFQLIGIERNSNVHLLRRKHGKILQRNSQDVFIFFEKDHLGNLIEIKLWHDCDGDQPDWYCEQVVIKDVEKSKLYTFKVEKWFSLFSEDGATSGQFTLSPEKENNFPMKCRNGARTMHNLLIFYTQRWRPNVNKETIGIFIATVSFVTLSVFLFVSIAGDANHIGLFSVALSISTAEIVLGTALDCLFRNSLESQMNK